MPPKDEDHPTPDLALSAALLSAAHRTRGPDQDPGPTLIPPVDPARVHALIPARRTLDATAAAMAAPGPDPALGPGLTATGARAHHAALHRTEEQPGMEPNPAHPSGPALILALLGATRAAVRVDASTPITETCPPTT